MQTATLTHYAEIQQQIENLNEIELIEVIDFIGFLQQKRTKKQRRLAIFKELQTKNFADFRRIITARTFAVIAKSFILVGL